MAETRDLLLEIGTEEIPARFLPPAILQMESLAQAAFKENSLPYEEIKVYATPRRLVLHVLGLATVQPDLKIQQKGPSVKAAYDKDGNPTKALLGFCKSQQAEPKDLIEKEISGNIYLYVEKHLQGRHADEVLPDILINFIHKIYFPKPMRWAFEEMRFARPIRWLLALWGNDLLPLTIAGIDSGRITRGHRVLGSQHIVIDNPSQYQEKLAENFVIVDQDQRRQLIWQQAQAVAASLNGKIEADDELLEEVVHLVEYPTALAGSFEDKYLAIPKELIITPMKEHQRYFPVYNNEGGLLPKFITVRNGDDRFLEVVAAGNEKVLRARLADAEFFWLEDVKTPLIDNLPKLDNIVFHEKLGSLRAKVNRVEKLALYLAKTLAYDGKQLEKVSRAAFLMKCDLVSHAVYEFTELQGIMGEYYAQKDQEDPEVSQAIREHYQPRFAGDELPQTAVGKVNAIAEKLDSVAGFFAIGIQPTGSQDPYALRRAASGMVQILVKNKIDISLADLIGYAYDLLANDVTLTKNKEEVIASVRDFLAQRLENILNDEGISYDTVNAIRVAGYDNIYQAYRRAWALSESRKTPGFGELLAGFTRAANIIKKNGHGEKLVRESLLEDQSEKDLHKALIKASENVQAAMFVNDYQAALDAIGSLRIQIDAFFNDVMVMADDMVLRNNRLALLSSIVDLTKGIGDLSLIVGK